MDGLHALLAPPPLGSDVSRLIGILYAEDFDDVAPPSSNVPQPKQVELAEPLLTKDDLEQACLEAVAAARQVWQSDADRQQADLLAKIKLALTDACGAAEQIALATAEATATAVLAMLSGALPHFCREHGATEARVLVDRLLPSLRSEPRVLIRVHADLAQELRRDLADLQAECRGTITVLPGLIEPGDVKVEWENGSLSRDTRVIHQAMQDALSQLGLQQARETMPKRKLTHAE